MPHDLVVMPQARPLSGSVPAPPDEDLSHLALLVAALADGVSELRRLSKGAHVAALVDALRRLGVTIEMAPENDATLVHGRRLRGFADPEGPVACGGSLATLHRLAAVLAAHPFRTVLTSDATRPSGMKQIAAALRRRAAQVEGAFSGAQAGELTSPFTVGPLAVNRALSGVEIELGEPRRDVKEALLLSGLYADEATYVREPIVSRDHLERMLQALEVPVSAVGPIVALDPAAWTGTIASFFFEVPGDVAAATLLSGVAALVPASRVCIRGVGLNPTRTGALELLRQMGAGVELSAQATRLGETEGTVCTGYAPLRSLPVAGELLLHAQGDLPVMVALAARARGTTEIAGVGDLAHADAFGENGVVAADFAVLLGAFGVDAVTPDPSRLVVLGRPEGALDAADIDAQGDAARATTALILGLLGREPTRIRNADALAERFPRLVGTLRALGADLRVERRD